MTRVARRSCRAGGTRLERVVHSTGDLLRCRTHPRSDARDSPAERNERPGSLRRAAARTSAPGGSHQLGPAPPKCRSASEIRARFPVAAARTVSLVGTSASPSLSWIGSETASRPSFVGGRVVPADLASVIRLSTPTASRHPFRPEAVPRQAHRAHRCRGSEVGCATASPNATNVRAVREKQNGPGRQLRAVR